MPASTNTTLLEVIAAYWPVLIASFVVSFALTPVVRRIALARNVVDHPDRALKTHKEPIPYCGGVAIFLGWFAGIVLALLLFRNLNDPAHTPGGSPSMHAGLMFAVLIAGVLITLLGLVDDVRSISPRTKLACNVAIAFIIVGSGIGDDIVRVFSGSARVRFDEGEAWLIIAYSVPLSVFIVVGVCNATNLIDGLDGLCSGVLGIISLGFLVLAIHLHLYSDWGPRDVQRVVLSLSLLGSSFGFLPFNRNPARVFMGDAGSMLLGLNAAILVLMFAEEQRLKWMMGAIVVFGLPLADLALTLARRWRAQRPLTVGDRSHFYDQLVDRGLSVRAVVRISYGLAACFAILGVLPTVMRTRHLILIYVVGALLLAYAVHRLKMLRVDQPAPTSRTGPSAKDDSS